MVKPQGWEFEFKLQLMEFRSQLSQSIQGNKFWKGDAQGCILPADGSINLPVSRRPVGDACVLRAPKTDTSVRNLCPQTSYETQLCSGGLARPGSFHRSCPEISLVQKFCPRCARRGRVSDHSPDACPFRRFRIWCKISKGLAWRCMLQKDGLRRQLIQSLQTSYPPLQDSQPISTSAAAVVEQFESRDSRVDHIILEVVLPAECPGEGKGVLLPAKGQGASKVQDVMDEVDAKELGLASHSFQPSGVTTSSLRVVACLVRPAGMPLLRGHLIISGGVGCYALVARDDSHARVFNMLADRLIWDRGKSLAYPVVGGCPVHAQLQLLPAVDCSSIGQLGPPPPHCS